MQRPRMILVAAAACIAFGMSLAAPEAHASPRGKTYDGASTFPQSGPVCFVFHSDGSFSFDLLEGVRSTGTWFEIGDLWFSFSTVAPPPGGLTLFVVMAGTTFEQDSGALNAAALVGFLDDPGFPLQPFLAAGHSGECDTIPSESPGDQAKELGKSR